MSGRRPYETLLGADLIKKFGTLPADAVHAWIGIRRRENDYILRISKENNLHSIWPFGACVEVCVRVRARVYTDPPAVRFQYAQTETDRGEGDVRTAQAGAKSIYSKARIHTLTHRRSICAISYLH